MPHAFEAFESGQGLTDAANTESEGAEECGRRGITRRADLHKAVVSRCHTDQLPAEAGAALLRCHRKVEDDGGILGDEVEADQGQRLTPIEEPEQAAPRRIDVGIEFLLHHGIGAYPERCGQEPANARLESMRNEIHEPTLGRRSRNTGVQFRQHPVSTSLAPCPDSGILGRHAQD